MKRTLLTVLFGTLSAFALAIGLIIVLDEAPSRHAELPEYLRPFRPVGIRIINAIGVLLGKLGLLDRVISLDPDSLIKSACSKLGPTYSKSNCVLLEDNGGRWHESFHRLTSALKGANLTFLGRLVALGQITDMLKTRGLLLQEFAKEQTSDTSPLHDPLFIVGLPRAGTTLLSRLLSIDPGNRGPTLWEYMNPVPQPPPPPPINAQRADVEAYRVETKDRIAEQQWRVDQYKSLAPGIDSMHPINATIPEECIIIMNYVFDSEQVTDTYPIHEFLEYLVGFEHHKDALRWNKRVLQYLERFDPYGPRRWVLKTPYYLTMMDDIRAVYPNAKIIHTHRDPEQSIISVSSVVAKMHSIVTDEIDLKQIGSQQAAVRETMLKKALDVRKKWAEEDVDEESSFRIVDVHLQDLQNDPIGAVNFIYKRLFDTGLKPEVAELMREWLDQNPRTKHGKHLPKINEFGLEGRVNSKVFEEYREMFGVRSAAPLLPEKGKQAEEKYVKGPETDSGRSEL